MPMMAVLKSSQPGGTSLPIVQCQLRTGLHIWLVCPSAPQFHEPDDDVLGKTAREGQLILEAGK